MSAVTKLITHHFALDHAADAFRLFGNQRDGVVNVVFVP